MGTAMTIILYLAIWLSTVGLAFLSQKKEYLDGQTQVYFRKVPYVLAFLIAWFFFAFTKSGTDYANYSYIYEHAKWSNLGSFAMEPGYVMLNVILKMFLPTATLGLMAIKTAQLVLAFLAIYDYRKKIHMGFAVLGYMTFCYLDSFCVLRINLAAAMLLFAVSLYQNRGKRTAAVIVMVLAGLMHNTALIFGGVVLVYLLWFRDRRNYFYSRLLLVSLVLAVIYISAVPLMQYLFNNVPFFSRYSERYQFIEGDGTGLMQYIWHIPFVLILMETWHLGRRPSNRTTSILAATMVLAPFSLFFGMLGYSIEVIGRTVVHFNYLWSVGIPCYYAWRKQSRPNWNTTLVGLCIFLWNAYRMYWFLTSMLKSAGIDTYRFIWQ